MIIDRFDTLLHMNMPTTQMIASLAALPRNGLTLTPKDMEEVEFVLDRSWGMLNDFDYQHYAQLLTEFIRLFVLCPHTQNQMFYRKLYSLFRDNMNHRLTSQQKYECFLHGLLEAGDKIYASPFHQLHRNNRSRQISEYADSLLAVSLLGGLHLKGFTNLFKKAIDKAKETRPVDFMLPLRASYLRAIKEFVGMTSTGKPNDSTSFRLYFLGVLVDHCMRRFQRQGLQLNRQLYQQYCATEDPQRQAVTLTYLLLRMGSKNQLSLAFMEPQPQVKHHSVSDFSNYLFAPTTLLISSFLKVVMGQGLRKDEGVYILRLMHKRFPLAAQLIDSPQHQLFSNSNLVTERLLAELMTVVRGYSIEFSKIPAKKIFKRTIRPRQIYPLELLCRQQNIHSTFTKKICPKIDQLIQLSSRSRIYFTTIFWLLVTRHAGDYQAIISLQQLLFKNLQPLLNQESASFVEHIYMIHGFKLPLSTLPKPDTSEMVAEVSTDLFKQLGRLVKEGDGSLLKEYFDSHLDQLKEGKITFQGLVELFHTFYEQQKPKEPPQQPLFNPLSLPLLTQITIVPEPLRPQSNPRSFIPLSLKPQSIFFKYFIKYLTKYDGDLRGNITFMNSLQGQQGASGNQKIIMLALKKYTSIWYNRLNDLILKRWIRNRQYLKLWSQLFCGKKVKAISDNFLKSDLSGQEMGCFFEVEPPLIKVFVEYLVSKDKHKFRLALWQAEQPHRQDLLDYSLISILH